MVSLWDDLDAENIRDGYTLPVRHLDHAVDRVDPLDLSGDSLVAAAVLLPMTRPPLVSHNLGSTVSLQLNCVWLPSTVMRPMTGTVPSFFTT